jgi:hypothetical protein
LSRAAAEAVGCNTLDWFNLSIQPLAPIAPGDARPDPLGPGAWIGAIRFPRRSARRAATIDPEAVMFLEVYSGARTWSDVAPWHVDVMAYGDGARCPSGRTEYPRPYNQRVRNASVRFDPGRARVDLSLGAGAVVQAPPARWP